MRPAAVKIEKEVAPGDQIVERAGKPLRHGAVRLAREDARKIHVVVGTDAGSRAVRIRIRDRQHDETAGQLLRRKSLVESKNRLHAFVLVPRERRRIRASAVRMPGPRSRAAAPTPIPRRFPA
ncbi:hypothetical protein OMP40_31945 [Cohnella rhizosphaerae]|uniref:Uncharacterized protein n=1 Tax=Cohnella rhizosphaerae TaxID=1457232 RepID=A0A9X4L4M8_9BACL|nr:hypothetical protein [Cohnella rhizosphaerae]MDG0813382.1 hypothetical protein [Cohnella rhizosphaerae]